MKTGLAVAVAAAVASSLATDARQTGGPGDGYTREFLIDKSELSPSGRNPYFILEPGYTLTLEDGTVRLVITVTPDTRTVDGVVTRVVEERETNHGQLVEVSRNFYAISTRSNSVFYFGEDVDMYKDGKITGHEGSWEAGAGHASFGLMMPGLPLLKARYYQEVAPGIAMDRAEIVSISETVKTPAGTFTHVLRTSESTPLEPLVRETKYYASGTGLIQDGSLKLVSVSKAP